MKAKCLAGAALLACAGAASAAVIFSDDFDASPTGLNVGPVGWIVSNGSVDVVSDTFFALCKTASHCIDLDGSTSDAGVLSRQLGLAAGVNYLLSFNLAGNRRGDIGFGPDDVQVTFGSATLGIANVAPSAPETPFTLAFTPLTSGLYTLSFANAGGDNVGALLDDVTVTSVPEPGTAGMAVLGLAALAGSRRRRPESLPAA